MSKLLDVKASALRPQERRHTRVYAEYREGTEVHYVRLVPLETAQFPHGLALATPCVSREDAERFADLVEVYMQQASVARSPSAWVAADRRLPTEAETVAGRVPALDADGCLITALVADNALVGNGLPIRSWLPLSPPATAPHKEN